MASGSPELSPRGFANHAQHYPRQPKRGAEHVDITGRDYLRFPARIGQHWATGFPMGTRFHVALLGTAPRSLAQLAGPRALAGGMECIGQRHAGAAAAPAGSAARLYIRLRARGTPHVVDAFSLAGEIISKVRSAPTICIDECRRQYLCKGHKSVNEL